MFNIVDDTMRVLEEGGELEITTGDDLRHALEMSIAVRESARRGHAPVTLPLEDRSLSLHPVDYRWLGGDQSGRPQTLDEAAGNA